MANPQIANKEWPKADKEWLKEAYLKAFAAANPGLRIPRLAYENGWWVIRGRWSNRRIRSAQLIEMMDGLKRRVTNV